MKPGNISPIFSHKLSTNRAILDLLLIIELDSGGRGEGDFSQHFFSHTITMTNANDPLSVKMLVNEMGL